jgi:GT2 family glycosyltransferase
MNFLFRAVSLFALCAIFSLAKIVTSTTLGMFPSKKSKRGHCPTIRRRPRLWVFRHFKRKHQRRFFLNGREAATSTRDTALIRKALFPKLGRLYQYQPAPLDLPARHKNTLSDNTPTVAVVIPSYNQGQYLERTITSLLEQRYPKLEIHVQDGGSKDETISVLKKFAPLLSTYRSEIDTGQSQAINRGFARARGEIMGWLNSDDLLLPDALMVVVEYFRQNPQVDVVYGNRLIIDESDREVGRWILPGHDNDVLSWGAFVPQETMFWRRRIWNKVGGEIDETFRFAMDWDLLLRFRKAGAIFAHVPRFLGAFRVHEMQKTSSQITQVGQQEMRRLRLRELGRNPHRREIKRALIPFILAHMAADAKYLVGKQLQSIRGGRQNNGYA